MSWIVSVATRLCREIGGVLPHSGLAPAEDARIILKRRVVRQVIDVVSTLAAGARGRGPEPFRMAGTPREGFARRSRSPLPAILCLWPLAAPPAKPTAAGEIAHGQTFFIDPRMAS
jgi:hypothetical protein